MARRKRKKETRDHRQNLLLLITGGALTLCFLSIVYGMLVRQSAADIKLRHVRIEILNGTGEAGVANRAAAALRKRGVDVLHVGNADGFSYRETMIVKRKKGADVRALARALGCDNTVEQLRDESLVDATLIVGADYPSLRLESEAD